MDCPSLLRVLSRATFLALLPAPLVLAGATSASAQCVMGASCSPSERLSNPAGLDPAIGATSPVPQQGAVGFSETFGTSGGAVNSFSRVGSSSEFPGAVVVTTDDAPATRGSDRTDSPPLPPQLNVPSSTALHSRLHPTLVTTDGPARSAPEGITGSLWNSENVLYKQDGTGAACSLNKQGPLIATCR